MAVPDTYTSTRYLAAKSTLDARSRHPRLLAHFLDALAATPTDRNAPLRLFEMGGGVGTLCAAVLDGLQERGVSALTYTLVDTDADAVADARERLADWGRTHSLDVFAAGDRVVCTDDTTDIALRLQASDALAHLDAYNGAPYHGIIAQAVLDIVHLPTALERFRATSEPGTRWYLPIHFDGQTIFEPTLDADLDATIQRLFHESMRGDAEAHGDKGGPHTGRRLLTRLPGAGAALEDAAASDWIVYADADGAYPGDEAYFLHHILHFVETELRDHPELDASAFDDWLHTRRAQVESGALLYIAHQVDVLARVEAA
jgi:hypothetical protein